MLKTQKLEKYITFISRIQYIIFHKKTYIFIRVIVMFSKNKHIKNANMSLTGINIEFTRYLYIVCILTALSSFHKLF